MDSTNIFLIAGLLIVGIFIIKFFGKFILKLIGVIILLAVVAYFLFYWRGGLI